MRSGKRSIPIEILVPGAGRNEYGEGSDAPVVWKQVWGEYLPLRGGELTLGVQVESQPTATFRFDYMDVMSPDGSGRILEAFMAFRIVGESQIWDIDVIHPDRATHRDVKVNAVGKKNMI